MTRRSYSGNAAPLAITGGTLASGGLSISTSGTATGWPTGASGKFLMVIDRGLATEEKILVTSRSANTFTVGSTGDRGQDGTTAQSHLTGAVVEHVIGALDIDEPNAHINTPGNDDHTQYLNVSGARALSAQGSLIGTPGNSAIGDAAAKGNALTVAASNHVHGREGPQRIGHTFMVANYVNVASGPIDYIPPIFIPVATGRTVKLVGYKCIVRFGSCTVKLQINGVDATGFTGLSVTTTASTATPTAISFTNGDQLALVVTASSSADNLSFTAYTEHA